MFAWDVSPPIVCLAAVLCTLDAALSGSLHWVGECLVGNISANHSWYPQSNRIGYDNLDPFSENSSYRRIPCWFHEDASYTRCSNILHPCCKLWAEIDPWDHLVWLTHGRICMLCWSAYPNWTHGMHSVQQSPIGHHFRFSNKIYSRLDAWNDDSPAMCTFAFSWRALSRVAN